MVLSFSVSQGDNRYCVVGYVKGDETRPEKVGWTNDEVMAKEILKAVRERWSRYGEGEILDFKRIG